VYRRLAALLVLVAAAGAAHAHELLDTIDTCIGRLDAQLDVGYERIAARCPQLAPALAQSPWAPWLPKDWNQAGNQLTAQGLGELRTLLAQAMAAPAPTRAPDAQRVAAVLERIAQPDAATGGWWPRFKAWLRRILGTPDTEPGAPEWLRWLDFSTGAQKLITWGALAAVAAIALGIVLNELRVHGLLRRRTAPGRGSPPAAPRPGTPSLALVSARAEREQPALLLELIAARLTEQGRLPPARSLTTRELLRRAQLPGESERTGLAELAGACEELRYSTRELAAARLRSAIHAGRQVLLQLEGGAVPQVRGA
jgi:hypothetical protein